MHYHGQFCHFELRKWSDALLILRQASGAYYLWSESCPACCSPSNSLLRQSSSFNAYTVRFTASINGLCYRKFQKSLFKNRMKCVHFFETLILQWFPHVNTAVRVHVMLSRRVEAECEVKCIKYYVPLSWWWARNVARIHGDSKQRWSAASSRNELPRSSGFNHNPSLTCRLFWYLYHFL